MGTVLLGRGIVGRRQLEVLRGLAAPGFRAKKIFGEKSVGFGGETAMLYRVLPPQDVRPYSTESLTAEIVADIRKLINRYQSSETGKAVLEQTSPLDTAVRNGRVQSRVAENQLSAAGLSEFLRQTHGLYFTPYQLAAFITALQAKGFVILSGISAYRQDPARCANSEPCTRPGTGYNPSPTGLAGQPQPPQRYYNPISKQYISTPLLRQLLPDGAPPDVLVGTRPGI